MDTNKKTSTSAIPGSDPSRSPTALAHSFRQQPMSCTIRHGVRPGWTDHLKGARGLEVLGQRDAPRLLMRLQKAPVGDRHALRTLGPGSSAVFVAPRGGGPWAGSGRDGRSAIIHDRKCQLRIGTKAALPVCGDCP